MFEQELELEKKSSSIVPLLLILALAGVIVGTVGYWVLQSKKVLTPQEAATVVSGILKAGTPTLRFHTGMIKPSVNEKPGDPHYKLLEKGGYVKLSKVKKSEAVEVALTPKGEKDLAAFPEFQKSKESDGTEAITVALAERKLVEVSKVTMNGPSMAKVEYTWQWQPTALGDLFDASGPAVKSFNIWETQKLIEKYGANFYHGSPSKATLNLVKSDKGAWEIRNQ